jgi:hypothetical protein
MKVKDFIEILKQAPQNYELFIDTNSSDNESDWSATNFSKEELITLIEISNGYYSLKELIENKEADENISGRGRVVIHI